MPSRLAALFILVSAAVAIAQENLFIHVPEPEEGTRVEVISLFSRPSPGGYLPVRVTVVNKGESDLHLNFASTSRSERWGNVSYETRSSFSITAPAGQTTVSDRLVPIGTAVRNSGYGGSDISIRMSGLLGEASGSLTFTYADDQPAILLSEPLFTPNASVLDSHAGSKYHITYGGSIQFAGKFDARMLPEDWRAYSGYDVIWMTETDWGTASASARHAILQWNRLGGHLVVFSQNPDRDLNTLAIVPGANGIREAHRSLGEVRISELPADFRLDPNKISELETGPNQQSPLARDIREGFRLKHWPLQDRFGEKPFNYTIFVFVLIAFGALVGPVNLFVFARSDRRHRMFVTTPLISLGASALLIILIIIQDGLGGSGMRVALMEIRPEDTENTSYVIQEQFSRTGVLLSGRFGIEEPVAIDPIPLRESKWARLTGNREESATYEMTFDGGQTRVSGDWFQSRSEQGQLIRTIVPTRGRIEAVSSGGGVPTFMSTFEFPIERMLFTDANGRYWMADNIRTGQSFTCRELSPEDALQFLRDTKDLFSSRNEKTVEQLSTRPEHFVALTTSAPGVETFRSIRWKETTTVLTGPVAKP